MLIPPSPQEPPSVDEILSERGSQYNSHGDFATLAALHRDLMDRIVAGAENIRGDRLPPSKEFAISMIIQKICRAICGDLTFEDHWDDIAGYAKLAKETDADD